MFYLICQPCSEGECVPGHLCKTTAMTDGSGIILIRNQIDFDNPCKESFESCCIDRIDKPPLPPINYNNTKCGNRNEQGVIYCITGDLNFGSQYGITFFLKHRINLGMFTTNKKKFDTGMEQNAIQYQINI